jgi:exopolysaccharide biosynthesis predicted pyruvyltransferase EpsI
VWRPGGAGSFTIRRRPGGDAETIEHGVGAPGAFADLTRESPLDEILATLEPYEFVLSDRLHGGLIALMMRKKTVFLPVGYHKIWSFWETWLADLPGSAFVERQGDLTVRMAALKPPTRDLGALFRERADPAFDRFLLAV